MGDQFSTEYIDKAIERLNEEPKGKRREISCKNCKHREKYTNHCSAFNRDILLTNYCSILVFEERDDIPNTKDKEVK